MIFVLMTSRSGSSMVCRILAEHGLKWNDPNCPEPRQLAKGGRAGYDTYENRPLKLALKRIADGRWPHGKFWSPRDWDIRRFNEWWKSQNIDFAKMAVEMAPLAEHWALRYGHDIRFIKVVRPADQVARSHEARFGRNYQEAFNMALTRYRLMNTLPGVMVHSEKIVDHRWNDSGLLDAFADCGLDFNEEAARRAIQPSKLTR